MKWSKPFLRMRVVVDYLPFKRERTDWERNPPAWFFNRELKIQVFPYYSISCDLFYCTWPQLQENCCWQLCFSAAVVTVVPRRWETAGSSVNCNNNNDWLIRVQEHDLIEKNTSGFFTQKTLSRKCVEVLCILAYWSNRHHHLLYLDSRSQTKIVPE